MDFWNRTASPKGASASSPPSLLAKPASFPLLSDLSAQYPGLSVELVLTDVNAEIIADGIDLAIRFGGRQAPAFAQDMNGVELFDIKYKVCASQDYLTQNGWPVAPLALVTHDCLLPDRPNNRDKWKFCLDDNVIQSVEVGGRMTISNPLAMRDACLAGLGPALLANWLIDEALHEGQAYRPLSRSRRFRRQRRYRRLAALPTSPIPAAKNKSGHRFSDRKIGHRHRTYLSMNAPYSKRCAAARELAEG